MSKDDLIALSESARIGDDCVISPFCVIEDDVVIGDGARIGPNSVIHKGTVIGKNFQTEGCCVVGRQPKSPPGSFRKTKEAPPLTIGDDCMFGAHVIAYAGTTISNRVMAADAASIREGCLIEDDVIVGACARIEYETVIQKDVVVQRGAHITGNVVVEEGVFVGPEVVTMNDNQMGRGEVELRGPVIKKGARIGGNATILPGVTIGRECLIGAGSVVTHDIEDYKVALGVPARVRGDVPPEHIKYGADQ